MLTISSIYKSKLCQASSQQLSKWPHNVQQGEKTGLGSWWGEEGPNFQSTSHLAFFLGPFSYPNVEESQNISSEFNWRQKRLTMKCMRCTHGEFLAAWLFRSFGNREKNGYIHLFWFACLVISFEDLGQWEDWQWAPGAQDRGINHPFENPWNLTWAQD